MKYANGQEVHAGDRVKLGSDLGLVVCSIDSGEFTEAFPYEAWSYLNKGVLIEFPSMGLIHYEELDEDMELVERASSQ